MTPKIISRSSRKPAPRILRIKYRSGVNGRVAVAFAKIPYGQAFDLSEKLTRLLTQREIRWYRIDEAKPDEIAERRETLQRWPEALRGTQGLTKVNLDA